MSTAAGVDAAAAVAFAAPRPWWRGKIGLVVAIVLVILVSYFGWKGQFPWPSWLTWSALSGYLDRFQNWLSAERNVANPSFFFTIFNGFATFLDNLVSWLTSFFLKLTWVGTTVLGVVVVLRFGSRRAALGVLAAFLSFALMGLWLESVQTFALMFSAVALSLLDRDAARRARGPLRPVPARDHAGARRDADRARVRLPDAGRDPVLGRAGRSGRDDDDLRDPARDPDHVARNPRRAPRTRSRRPRRSARPAGRCSTKVQLPLARRMLLLSVNQVILFALSMVVIAGLIGGPGLGDVVTNGLYSNPALAILAGAAIVIMAIALDRATESMAERTDPSRRHVTEAVRRRLHLETLAAAAAVGLVGRARATRSARARCTRAQRPGLAARPDPVGARLRPEPGHRRLRDLVPDRQLHRQVRPRAAEQLLRPDAVVRDAARADGDRVRRQRAAPGYHNARRCSSQSE